MGQSISFNELALMIVQLHSIGNFYFYSIVILLLTVYQLKGFWGKGFQEEVGVRGGGGRGRTEKEEEERRSMRKGGKEEDELE